MPESRSQLAAPILLRVALGVTFLWAGLGKLEATMDVKGDVAAKLATMGVERVREQAPPGKTTPPKPIDPAPGVSSPSPLPPAPSPATDVVPTAPAAPSGVAPTVDPAQAPPVPPPQPAVDPMGPPYPPPDQPVASTQPSVPPAPGPFILTLAQVTAPSVSAGAGQPDRDRVYVAQEFPDTIEIPRVYGLALLLDRAANPPPQADGSHSRRLWPRQLGSGAWCVRMAWAVAITELVAGALVLLGLFTRVGALALAGAMVGAMWLTEVGPALQSGNTMLWLLPQRDAFDINAWKTLLWQMALLASSLALALLGSGAFAFDRRLFPPPPPAPPKPRPMI